MIRIFVLFLFSFKLFSQDIVIYPQFENCENENTLNSEMCFKNTFYKLLINNKELKQINNGIVDVVFETTTDSKFEVLYISGLSFDENSIITKVIQNIKINKPALVNNLPSYLNFRIKLKFPLKIEFSGTVFDNVNSNYNNSLNVKKNKKNNLFFESKEIYSNELELINIKFFDNNINTTKQNIPFTHFKYNEFEDAINKVGQNTHTASKPYTYNEVNKYYDFLNKEKSYIIKTRSWLEKKLFNENLVEISGNDYWFVINPILDLQLGKDSKTSEITYLNTRAIQVKGKLGEKINFSTTIFESQGRFAEYYNDYAISIKPAGGSPAIIPGIGTAKKFKENSFDFPSADALISYSANNFIDLQLGYGRNFLGDGYRSLFLSDGSSPYTFAKINTSFWKIKYTNIYGWLKDVRPEALIEGTYSTKYMASHYLSWNVTNKLNIGFFESVIWSNANNRGFDANFINPLIFYRSIEFVSSPKTGNALLGLSTKYKFNNQINIYGQFLIDEFALEDVTSKNDSWRNKFAYQIGMKYYNVFNVEKLNLQLEYNKVRPYVYSHSNVLTNYGHYNQSLGHNWGSNFQEFITIIRYNHKRWFAELKLIIAKRGFDYDTNDFNYGSNIFKDYDENRFSDEDVIVGQGLLTNQIIIESQIKYILNYKTNLNLFIGHIYRSNNFENQNNSWVNFGLKSEIFNWYLDY
jgi:hypothetical protein